MTAPVPGSAQAAWEDAGRRASASLDRASAVVIVGEDPVAAASVALGIGRVQSRRRRVAIGDLVGEVEPLQALVSGDDPHGLVDSFLYGVSLNKIARPADASGNLFVLPSGSEPVVAEEIFRNERWARLAIGFRDVGALLLLVAPLRAPGLDALIAQTDGVLLAGRGVQAPPDAFVLDVAELPARVARELAAAALASTPAAAPPPTAPQAEAAPALAPAPAVAPVPAALAPSAPSAAATAVAEPPMEEVPAEPLPAAAAPADPPTARWIRRIAEAPPTRVNVPVVAGSAGPASERPADEAAWTPPRRRLVWAYPLAAAVLIAIIGTALLTRGGGTRSEAGRRANPAHPTADSSAAVARTAGAAAAVSAGDSARPGTPAGAAAVPAAVTVAPPPAAPMGPPVANPADSATAASFSVQIVAANTMEGARAKLRDVALGLPATVISPMSLGADGTRWYRLTVGAFADRQAAAAFLTGVATRRKLDLDPSNIVRLPYALLVANGVPRVRAKARAKALSARGLPAYALVQRDGTARIYAGAFETPEQTALLAAQLRDAGIEPVVVFRTGSGY